MLDKINSSTSFGRKQDIPCIKEAEKTLRNIYQKYVNNGLLVPKAQGNVLILTQLSSNPTAEVSFDEVIKTMSKKNVQDLLKKAQKRLQNYLTERAALLIARFHRNQINEITRAHFTTVQKNLLYKMQEHGKTEQGKPNKLITIPEK